MVAPMPAAIVRNVSRRLGFVITVFFLGNQAFRIGIDEVIISHRLAEVMFEIKGLIPKHEWFPINQRNE